MMIFRDLSTLVTNDALSILDPKTGRFIDCNETFIKIYDTASKRVILDSTPTSFSPEYQPNGQTSKELAQEQQQIEHMAHYDTLTNLPNRTLFLDRLDQIIARSQRYNQEFALMFIDLDHFKEVNDTYGHDIGDILLRQTTERLSSCVRKMDVLGRMGGDEFTLALTEIKSPLNAEKIAKKIIAHLREPFVIKDHRCQIGCSIGISLYPLNGIDTQTLLKCSDSAMYEAKKERNTFKYF